MDKKSEDEVLEEEIEESDKERGNTETENGNTETLNEEEKFVSEEVEPEDEEEPRKYFTKTPSNIYAGSRNLRSGKKIPSLLGILAIILILGGLFYFLKVRPGTKVEPSPSPISVIEESTFEPSPTPFERSNYTLRILNGTKTQDLAASTSAKLKELGYKIERTGNATNSAFLKTVVRVKPDLEELLENLLKDLSGLDFEGEEGPALKDSDASDGEMILGAE